MIAKMIILRLLGSSDDKEKEKIGVARPEGPPIRGTQKEKEKIALQLGAPEEPTLRCLVQEEIEVKSAYRHRLNRRFKKGHRCIGLLCTRDDVKCPGEVSSAPVQPTVHRSIASVH